MFRVFSRLVKGADNKLREVILYKVSYTKHDSTMDYSSAGRSMLKFEKLVPIIYLIEAVTLCQQHHYRHSVPEKYWEAADGWEMQVWSPNGYRINLEGHAPGKRD
jgi:hypothetical protein